MGMRGPVAILDSVDESELFAHITEGKTFSELSKLYGLSLTAVHNYLHRNPEVSAQTRTAMQTSAEAWLDRGMQPLQEALKRGSDIDVNAARAYAQECARRAAIRNPAYRDKGNDGDKQSAPTIQVVVLSNDGAQARLVSPSMQVIDHEGKG